MATSRNQPHPSASPPITSVSQCTPSSARLVATATAMTPAPAASQARVTLPRSRPRTRATAAQAAAAAVEWPDGNEDPDVSTSCITSGRSRSMSSLSTLLISSWPMPDGGDEGEDLGVAPLRVVDDGDRQQGGHDHGGAAEVGDHLEHVDGCRGGVLGAPLGDAVVELGESRPGVDHVEQQAEDDGDSKDDQEADREHEPAASPAVEALPKEAVDSRVPGDRADDRLLLGCRVDRIELLRRRADERERLRPARPEARRSA